MLFLAIKNVKQIYKASPSFFLKVSTHGSRLIAKVSFSPSVIVALKKQMPQYAKLFIINATAGYRGRSSRVGMYFANISSSHYQYDQNGNCKGLVGAQ